MILISELINFINIATPIYRTIAPLEIAFPVVTMTLDNTDVQQCLDGDVKIENLNISLNCFGATPASADTLQTTLTDKLATHKGTQGQYTITGFYLLNRKSIDYADETTGKLVFGNQLQYRLTVKKS